MHSSRLALAAALAALAVAAPAAAKKPEPAAAAAPGAADPKNISAKVRPLLAAEQKADAAGDFAGALAQVRAAEALGDLNPTDVYFVTRFKLGIGIKTKDNALIVEALKAQVDSPLVPNDEKIKFLGNLASLEYQANDFTSSAKYFEQLGALTPNDAEIWNNLSIIYAKQKAIPQAIGAIQKGIAAAKASGKPADENLYRRELQLASDAKMAPEVQSASMDLIKAYPNATNWRDVLLLYREAQKLDDQGVLDIFRLMDTAGALNGERDYAEYIETAISRGLPGEAKTVLTEGIAKGMVSPGKPYVADYNKSITTRLANDKAGMATADKEARGAATGKAALGQGDAYYGYGEFAKAAEMYRLALSKGGVDAPTANLRLGVALAKGGDKAGAATAFAAVDSGPRAGLAKYWTIWLSQKA